MLGPLADHTLGTANGTYMYIETSRSGSDQDPAQLETAMYVSSADKCKLTFWYSMYGRDVGNMNVYLKTERGKLLKLWGMSGNQGQDWKQVKHHCWLYFGICIFFHANCMFSGYESTKPTFSGFNS